MMAEEDTSKYAAGFRFNPFDDELISGYLKPMIMGKQLPCNLFKFRQVYGPSSNPWLVFDPNDHLSWLRSPDLKETEKYMYVFAKLSKLSRSNNTTTCKNTSKRAGCGTWVGKTKRDKITDAQGNVIGEKRYLVFEIKDIDSAAVGVGFDFSKVGFYRMHEYSLSGVNSGLDSAHSIVLCKITHDSSKECPIAKSCTKSGDHVSRSSSEAPKKEENNNKNLEGIGSVTAQNLTLIEGGGGENLEESRILTSKNLTVIDSGVGVGVGEESGTLTSESLVVINSDVGDQYAAAIYNNGPQELDDFGGGFCFDDLGVEDFCLGDLGAFDTDWLMACLDSNQEEEPFEDSTRTLGKRKFELEKDLYQAKKMCLDNDY